MMKVQAFLLTHSLDDLKSIHKVNSRIHDHKVSLNYNTIEADENDLIASECRGLVLLHQKSNLSTSEVVGETTILSRTMARFFNHGQSAAADINFSSVNNLKFYEKLDGTMCSFYWDPVKNEWHVGTRSIPEANLPIDGFGNLTFRTLFEKALEETTSETFQNWVSSEDSGLNKQVTYIFELCTPANRIVVNYDDYKVTLLAARKTVCGTEEEIENVSLKNVPRCKTYKLSSFEDMMKFVSSRDPESHEGVVVVDKNFNRVKVKNANYLALSKIKESVVSSPRAVVELCLKGKLDDVLPLLPDHMKSRAEIMQTLLRKVIANYDDVYDKVSTAATKLSEDKGWDYRKSLAISAKNTKFMAYVMTRYTQNMSSFDDYLENQLDKETGSYKKSFLQFLVSQIEELFLLENENSEFKW